jgi:hypothetical protein
LNNKEKAHKLSRLQLKSKPSNKREPPTAGMCAG